MESIIKDNLLNFALFHNIITSKQFGFLPKRSKCSQMLDCIIYDWRNAMDSNNTIDVIMIDFCKTFDVDPYKLLPNKLSSSGVCPRTLGWPEAFLCGRSQVVNVNGATFSCGAFTSEVIHGSVIGPALFVLYVNDLPSICAQCEIEISANDAKAYKVIRSPHDRNVLQ